MYQTKKSHILTLSHSDWTRHSPELPLNSDMSQQVTYYCQILISSYIYRYACSTTEAFLKTFFFRKINISIYEEKYF